jgi:hypothetical protein
VGGEAEGEGGFVTPAENSAVTAPPPPVRGKPFKRGKSGNPGGRPATSEETKAALRAALPQAIERLVKLLKSKDERVALAASQVIMNRVLGREPPTVPDEAQGREDGLTKEQAAAIVEAAHGVVKSH